jgi:alanine dehydrogenase
MNISVPKERQSDEHRVGLTPTGARVLIDAGHKVYCERGCGLDAGYADKEYADSGATVVFSREEVYGRGDIVCGIKAPGTEDYDMLREGQIIGGFLHLLVAPRALTDVLVDKKITTLCYEEMTEDGFAPLLSPASEIGGRMMPQIAARYMETSEGGRGKLLMGTPGVPAAVVAIVGGGFFGYHAALTFLHAGANVLVLDTDFRKLQRLDRDFGGHINTLISTENAIAKVLTFADVIISAVHRYGEVAPKIITREMLKTMIPRSLFIDVSIDQGGTAETSRPTTLHNPVYVVDEILHYCVPNVTSNVARTASRAHTIGLCPILLKLGKAEDSLKMIEGKEIFRTGAFIVEGKVVQEHLRELHHEKRGRGRKEDKR